MYMEGTIWIEQLMDAISGSHYKSITSIIIMKIITTLRTDF